MTTLKAILRWVLTPVVFLVSYSFAPVIASVGVELTRGASFLPFMDRVDDLFEVFSRGMATGILTIWWTTSTAPSHRRAVAFVSMTVMMLLGGAVVALAVIGATSRDRSVMADLAETAIALTVAAVTTFQFVRDDQTDSLGGVALGK